MTGESHAAPETAARAEPLAGAALELDGLERCYGERVALSGVTVRLGASETLVVLGSNGAGKTTLLRVLATLLRPHAGVVRVLGHDLPDDAWRARGSIGYLGHDPLLYRELTGRENLRYHAELHGLGRRGVPDVGFAVPGGHNPSSSARERVEERLTAVGMTRRADEPVRDLSKGMVQRLAVARATLHDPRLLLLDEPRANLDPAAAEALEPLIGRASGKTRVLVTHDVEGGLAEADVALGLRGGKQIFCQPATEVDAATARGLYS
jgi:heme exporter protein A